MLLWIRQGVCCDRRGTRGKTEKEFPFLPARESYSDETWRKEGGEGRKASYDGSFSFSTFSSIGGRFCFGAGDTLGPIIP